MLLRILVVALVILGLFALGVFRLAKQSREGSQNLGLRNGALSPCGANPNCVCSEKNAGPRIDQRVERFLIEGEPGLEGWRRWLQLVEEAGGSLIQSEDGYARFEFETAVFGFVDDLETRLAEGTIHVRSASRVGRSDLGVNRRRLEGLRARWKTDT